MDDEYQLERQEHTPPTRVRQAALLTWLRLARIYQRVDRASAARLRAADLSVAQFDVLVHLGVAEGLTQQELADQLAGDEGQYLPVDRQDGATRANSALPGRPRDEPLSHR